jgi:CheY-like chemotaxis protein
MTANAMAVDRKRCLDAGMVDFVAKPVEPEQLFNRDCPLAESERARQSVFQ